MVKNKTDVIILNKMTNNDVQDQIERNNYGKGQDKLLKNEDIKNDEKKDA